MSKKAAKRVKNILLTVLRMILLAVLSFIVGINIYNWNARKLMGETLPMPFGYGVAVVLSGSMEPELSVDDIVIIKKTDDIQINDIVVFESGNSLIIHRVISVDDETIQTQGDANNAPDERISISSVKGELAFVISGAGVITHIARSPMILICFVILVLLLLELVYKREKDTEAEQIDKAKKTIGELTNGLQNNPDNIDVKKLKEYIERIENELKNQDNK